MAKKSKPKTPAAQSAPTALVAPVPLTPNFPSKGASRSAPTDPVPIPRQRGDGPICEACGSGMIHNGTGRPNHPFRRINYYKCLNPKCDQTTKRITRR